MALLKVGIVEPVGGHGGMNYYDFGLGEGLRQCGVDVSLYTCEKTLKPPNVDVNVIHSFSGVFGKGNSVLRGARFLMAGIKTAVDAKRRGISLLHFHFFHYGIMEMYLIVLSRYLGFRIVVTAHDVESFAGGYSERLCKYILSSANAVIAHNNVSKVELINKVGLATESIHIVPHGNYLAQSELSPSRESARSRLKIDEGRIVILFFGQIKEVKGLDIAIAALGKLISDSPSFNPLLIIAGKVWKDDFDKYSELINKYGLKNNVLTDVRYISDEEALTYYAASNIVVLPYRRIYQSGVLLMAMSLKRCVVASDLPGMVEVLGRDGKYGLLFKSNDHESLANLLGELLSADCLLDDIGEHAYLLMKDSYSWRSIGEQTYDVYKSVA